VERRTHQALSVPELPGGHPYMTQIDLEVVEYEGGYQDRNGNKSGRFGASQHLYLRVEGSVMKAILLWVWGSDLGGLRRLLRKCCVPVLTNLAIFDLNPKP
jgi:hypothetical protein